VLVDPTSNAWRAADELATGLTGCRHCAGEADKLYSVYLKLIREPRDHVPRRVPDSALDPAEAGSIDTDFGGESFNGEAAILAHLTDGGANLCGGGRRHGGGASRCRPRGTTDYNPRFAATISGGITMRAGIGVQA